MIVKLLILRQSYPTLVQKNREEKSKLSKGIFFKLLTLSTDVQNMSNVLYRSFTFNLQLSKLIY